MLLYFNGFQNQNLPVLRLKLTQTTEMKQTQTFFHGTYSNLTPCLFLPKNGKVFQWLTKSKFLSFMAKVNLNYGNESKSDIFPWVIFKSVIYFFLSKNIKLFQWLLKSRFHNFMMEVNRKKRNETKSNFFSWSIFKSDIMLHWSQNSKMFQLL